MHFFGSSLWLIRVQKRIPGIDLAAMYGSDVFAFIADSLV